MASKLKIFTLLFRNCLLAPLLDGPPPMLSSGPHVVDLPGSDLFFLDSVLMRCPPRRLLDGFPCLSPRPPLEGPGKVGVPELGPEGAWGADMCLPVDRLHSSAPGFGKGLAQQSYFNRSVGFGQGVLKAAVKKAAVGSFIFLSV